MSASAPDPQFEALLEFVRDARAFDYTGYKRPTLMRRFQLRMDEVDTPTFGDYRAYLEKNEDEFARLFDTIMINVTGFFRDPEVWEYVAAEVVPRIVEQKDEGEQVRIWSAGSASGEEAYTAAMLFAEALGEDAFRRRLKIYATDLDENELSRGRQARYTAKQVEGMPPELRERYLEAVDGDFVFRNDIRRTVVFGRNDLLQDPPIPRVDLLMSRNTLMYFSADAQQRILTNFFFALRPDGFVVMGKAEALQGRTHLFEPLDLRRRVFVKNRRLDPGPRAPRAPRVEPRPGDETGTVTQGEAFEHAPLALFVVARDGRISAINQPARALFGLENSDVNRPFSDTQVSYRPVELRSLIEQVEAEHRPVTRQNVPWIGPDGRVRHLDVQVSPLLDAHDVSGVVVSFADVTALRVLNEEVESARLKLQIAYEELQSTVEELETTNEELQSTNEELETTNEELQSTNEELETLNEELQSTNEELATINDEMAERTHEALRANSLLSSILSSIQQSVVVVDRGLRVLAWSRTATEVWGAREDEVLGEHFLNLDIGVPTGDLRDAIRVVLAGETTDDVVLAGHDRRGHSILTTVSLGPLLGPGEEVQGAILLMTSEREREV